MSSSCTSRFHKREAVSRAEVSEPLTFLVELTSIDFGKLRDDATNRYKTLQEQAQPVMKVIEDPEAVAKLRSGLDREKNLDLLRSEYNVCSTWFGLWRS